MKSEQIDKEIIRIRGHYFEKYGEEMDPWEARLHHESEEHYLKVENQIKIAIEEIIQARTAIKGQVRNVQFNNWKPAFTYAFGSHFLDGFAVLILVWFPIYFFLKLEKVKAINKFYAQYENTLLYKNLISKGAITKKDKVNYLILTPVKGTELTIGEEYIYDDDNKRVLVPLGKVE